MPTPPQKLPGNGFLGWLGRQIGYVKKAVHTPAGQQTLYKTQKTEEQPHPEDPSITLRRTTTDEAIKKPDNPS